MDAANIFGKDDLSRMTEVLDEAFDLLSSTRGAAEARDEVGGIFDLDHTDGTNHKVNGECEDQCDGVTCQNGGTCVDGVGAYGLLILFDL